MEEVHVDVEQGTGALQQCTHAAHDGAVMYHEQMSAANHFPHTISEACGPYGDMSPGNALESNAAVRPSHVTPPDFRGPQPHESDAEDIAPAPLWVPMVAGLDSLGSTPNIPMNKSGWRYTAAGPAAEHLPQSVYRVLDIAPREVHWSWQDRSAFMRINRDASVVGTDKGFRSARTNVGVRYGACYVEIRILSPDASSSPPVPMRDGPHARVGWGRREASLNAPVGYDAYSYGLRDTSGSRVTLSQLQPFGESFGPGDVVGMYIRLPPPSEPVPSGSEGEINRKHIPIRYKGQLYFESLEYAPTREMEMVMDQSRRGGVREPDEARARRAVPPSKQKKPPRPLPRLTDSCIGFVVNGKPQGIAYTDLYDYRPLRSSKSTRETVVTPHSSAGAILKTRGNPYDDGSLGYFPMVSLYGGARAQLITREFVYPPAADIEDRLWHASEVRQGAPIVRQRAATPWRAIGDLYSEWFANEWSHDLAAERSLRATDST